MDAIETWKSIRNAALTLVIATQRRDGFLGVPTTIAETESTYADADEKDHLYRKSQGFGFPSISVSLNGLIGLRDSMEIVPKSILDGALHGLATHCDGEGGYGTPGPRRQGSDINAVPRHTANGMITRILFDTAAADDVLYGEMTSSFQWLLAKRRNRNGWAYNPNKINFKIGFMTTSSCIYAITLYAQMFKLHNGKSYLDIQRAIDDGMRSLLKEQCNGAWSGDGGPLDTQYRDSATALRFLTMASNSESGLWSEFSKLSYGKILSNFVGKRTQIGSWPKNIYDQGNDICANIEGLRLLQEVGRSDESFLEIERSVTDNLLRLWNGGEGWDQLKCWDWQTLAGVSGNIAGKLPSMAFPEIEKSASKFRNDIIKQLGPSRKLQFVPPNVRSALVFASSGGEPNLLVSLWQRSRRLAWDVMRDGPSQLFWAVMLAMLGALYAWISS